MFSVFFFPGITVDNKTIWRNMNGQMAKCMCVCVEIFRMSLTSADANVKNGYLTVFEWFVIVILYQK